MRSWYLKKEWVDREEDVQDVHILYSCLPPGFSCDGDGLHSRLPLANVGTVEGRAQDADAPLAGNLRQRVLELPALVWDAERDSWSAQYSLYYRYEVIQNGRRWATELFCDEIVYRDLEYVDWEGRLSGVGIYWSVADWSAPAWVATEDSRFVEVFGRDHERCARRFYRFGDKPRFALEKWNLMKQLPLPWRWSARIHAPKGSAVRQRWHIGNLSPGIDWEGWDPNPPGDFVHFL